MLIMIRSVPYCRLKQYPTMLAKGTLLLHFVLWLQS